ncbi:MAG: hypothetical protein IJ268_12675 [Proteobacteria bacterium]|nr:hypothetical protein [Pseudomonadota bacterium]
MFCAFGASAMPSAYADGARYRFGDTRAQNLCLGRIGDSPRRTAYPGRVPG